MKNLKETPFTKDMLMQMYISNLPHFEKIWEGASVNEMYNRGKSWTDKEIKQVEAQGRNAYSIPLIASKLTIIKGEQKKNKTVWKVEAASDPEDEPKAVLATMRLRDIGRQNNWQYKKNEVFDSGIGVCHTPVQICIEKDNDYNDVIKLKIRDYRDIIWDSNSKNYERDDAVFMAVSDKVYRYQLEADYKVSAQPSQEVLFGREKIEYFVTSNHNGDRPFDIVNKITHYHKVMRDYWKIIFMGECIYESRSKKEAEEYLRMLLAPYLNSDEEIPVHSIVKAKKEKLDKYKHLKIVEIDWKTGEPI
jgi:hypothetical protein